MKNKLKNTFIILNFLLIVGIFLILFYEREYIFFITSKAISEFQEGEEEIKSYPIEVNLDYVKGLEKEIPFSVLNNEHKNMQVLLTIEGELNSSITLYESLVEFLPSEESKSFTYKINLDKELEPGLHKARIVALEIPKTSPEGVYAGSVSKIVSELNVYVSYPGKYIEAELSVLNAEQNKTSDFVISVINRGKNNIEKVKAIIDVYTLLNEKITTIETNYSSVKVKKREKVSAKWFVDVYPGDYIAKFNVFYDGENRSFEKKFAIGAKNLTIEGILVNNFQLGEIAKLQILVENKWNQELKSVFVNLIIFNKDNQVMTEIRSAPEDIFALSKKELIAYWDTGNVEEGEYNGRLAVKYGDKSTEKNLIFSVSQDSLDVFGIGYIVRPKIMEGATLTTILLILVILLLIVNLSWFVFFRRFIGKKK